MNDNAKAKSADETRLDSIMEQWRKTLPPREFTLGTVGNGSTKGTLRHYPDLDFKEDEEIPGLYYAKLDPSNLPKQSGNGNGHVKIDGLEEK
jgi:hypothetical protein